MSSVTFYGRHHICKMRCYPMMRMLGLNINFKCDFRLSYEIVKVQKCHLQAFVIQYNTRNL